MGAEAVVELANWDTSKIRNELQGDIDAHIASVRAAKLSELTTTFEVYLIILYSLWTFCFL